MSLWDRSLDSLTRFERQAENSLLQQVRRRLLPLHQFQKVP